MTRKPVTRSGTPERRAQILAAALSCFTAHGVEATTIDDLRRASGCSTGSLYHHFGSKEGVAGQLFIEGIEQLNADLLEQLAGCDGAEAGVRTVVTQYCDWVTRHSDLAGFLLRSRDIAFSPEAKRELKSIHRRHIRQVFHWFAPHVRGGHMKRLPPETYVPLISGPIQDYARHWLSGRVAVSPADVKDIFATAAWSSVRTID